MSAGQQWGCKMVTTWALLLALLACGQRAMSDEMDGEFYLTMSNSLVKEDTPLCRAVAVDSDEAIYLTDIVPHASAELVIFMTVNGCIEPGSDEEYWDCDEQSAFPCQGKEGLIYAWSKGFPELKMPDGVGFKIGGDTGINYLVMQILYASVDPSPSNAVDQPGFRVKYTFNPLARTAGLLMLMINGGTVQPGQEQRFEMTCPIEEDLVLYPFAFRTFSHQLAVVTSGYRMRGNKWDEIGRSSPHLPEPFAPIHPVPLTRGDKAVVKCTLFNPGDDAVTLGATAETCIFEIFYYVDEEKTLSTTLCQAESDAFSNTPTDESVIPLSPNGTDSQHPEPQENRRREQTLLDVLRRLLVLP